MNNPDQSNMRILAIAAVLAFSTNAVAAEKTPIREGTALAKLVAEAEGHVEMKAAAIVAPGMKLDLPGWLLAHYRRNHTEMTKVAAAADPTGGYPLALENLYTWMLLHQDLQPPPEPPSKAAALAAAVGPNLNISGTNDTPRSESDIRINYTKPEQIIAASNNIGNGRQAHFFSADGGASWGQTTLPLLAGDSLHSDPTVDWTSDGTGWATTIGINAGGTVLQMRAYKSTDGGKTWTFDATFSGSQTAADKQLMWVDRSATSPFRDRIYVIWHNNRPAFIGNRRPEGWQPPLQVSGAETTGTAIGSDITTNGAGHVFAVWPDTGSRNLFFVKSTNGGEKFDSPVPIGKTFGSFDIAVPAFAERRLLIAVSIAALKNDSRDDVYVSWTDLSGEQGCKASNNEPADDVDANCKTRVWFARSTDGGKTWTEPAQKINDEAGRTDQFNQRLAVDPETGHLGIIYYNTGTGATRKKTNVMFQFSTDNGKTWKPPTKVTSAPTDETTGGANEGNQYGDYNGLSVHKGLFFPCWTDRRDNKSEAIFTARITLQKNASGELEPMLLTSGRPLEGAKQQ